MDFAHQNENDELVSKIHPKDIEITLLWFFAGGLDFLRSPFYANPCCEGKFWCEGGSWSAEVYAEETHWLRRKILLLHCPSTPRPSVVQTPPSHQTFLLAARIWEKIDFWESALLLEYFATSFFPKKVIFLIPGTWRGSKVFRKWENYPDE